MMLEALELALLEAELAAELALEAPEVALLEATLAAELPLAAARAVAEAAVP